MPETNASGGMLDQRAQLAVPSPPAPLPKVGNPLSSKLDVELTLPQVGEESKTVDCNLLLYFVANQEFN